MECTHQCCSTVPRQQLHHNPEVVDSVQAVMCLQPHTRSSQIVYQHSVFALTSDEVTLGCGCDDNAASTTVPRWTTVLNITCHTNQRWHITHKQQQQQSQADERETSTQPNDSNSSHAHSPLDTRPSISAVRAPVNNRSATCRGILPP